MGPLLLAVGLLVGIGAADRPAWAAETFGLQNVVAKAKEMAGQPYQKPESLVPQFLRDLKPEDWRAIRFRTDKSPWRQEKLPFEVQFFHLGMYYDRPVTINIVDSSGVNVIPFSADYFDYGPGGLQVPPNIGWAGFRLHYPLNTAKYLDEVLAFLGATYFRAVAKGQRYGLAARGLAVDTAQPSGEEFPYFREFWLEKPAPKANQMVVYALLDGPSCTGAYKFTVSPGLETVIKVECTLFQRHRVQKLGLAPLTSMYLRGENIANGPLDDFRPEVHDSDGLALHTGNGEWLWRPLAVTDRLQVNSFHVNNPKGFGLLQRDVVFDHYQDLNARFDLRPSVWITPNSFWGEGQVELIQIPTPSEIHDNVIAFWVPKDLPEPGQPIDLSYTMRWYSANLAQAATGRVTATRTGKGREDRERTMVVDFAGGLLEAVPSDTDVEAVVTVGDGAKLVDQQVEYNPVTGGWRLLFHVRTEGGGALERVLPSKRDLVEMRAYLKHGDNVLTETWSYGVQL